MLKRIADDLRSKFADVTSPTPPERRVPRLRQPLTAHFELEGTLQTCVACDFSEVGLFLWTRALCEVGESITFEIETYGRSILLQGKVVSTQEAKLVGTSDRRTGMGIKLESPPAEYTDLVSRIRGGNILQPLRRRDHRFELKNRVRFPSQETFLTEYTQDLSHGGMYLSSERELLPGELIQAELEIPGVEKSIEVRGRVTHRLTPERARELGRDPGVGIQFVELDPQTTETLGHHLSRVAAIRARRRRQPADRVPPTGDFSDYLVPEILPRLAAENATGVLILRRYSAEKRVSFHLGRPSYVESSLPSESLEQCLVRRGELTPSDAEISLANLAEDDLHHAQVLARGKMLGPAQLSDALIEIHEERLFSTFSWFDGSFEFQPHDERSLSRPKLPLCPYRILLKGVQKTYDLALVEACLGLTDESVVCDTGRSCLSPQISDDVIRFLRTAATPKTIFSLRRDLTWGADVLYPIVLACVLAGWVKVTGPGA